MGKARKQVLNALKACDDIDSIAPDLKDYYRFRDIMKTITRSNNPLDTETEIEDLDNKMEELTNGNYNLFKYLVKGSTEVSDVEAYMTYSLMKENDKDYVSMAIEFTNYTKEVQEEIIRIAGEDIHPKYVTKVYYLLGGEGVEEAGKDLVHKLSEIARYISLNSTTSDVSKLEIMNRHKITNHRELKRLSVLATTNESPSKGAISYAFRKLTHDEVEKLLDIVRF